MKITRIEPILISVPYRHGGPPHKGDARPWFKMDTLFIRVETDEGVTGWGEGFGFGACRVTMAALTALVEPVCLGRDPADRATLIAELRRRLHNFGRDGPVMFAISGIDVALWDIAGKIAGQPLYRLLGGPARETLPAYASLLRYEDPALVARNCADAATRGYGEIKLHEVAVPAIAAARDAIGASMPLMVDVNCAWSADEAIAIARQVEEHDLLWIEEPVWPPSDFSAIAAVRRDGPVAVAAGENAGSVEDLMRLVDMGAVDYVQPSVNKIGGVTEMLRLFDLAAQRNAKVAPHSPYFGPGFLATIHLAAAQSEPPIVERFFCDLEASPLGGFVNADGGMVRVPNGAGLGVDVDEAVLARYRVA